MEDPQVERFLERLQEDKALNEEYRSALAAAIDTAVAAIAVPLAINNDNAS